jgi:hypothetical protein
MKQKETPKSVGESRIQGGLQILLVQVRLLTSAPSPMLSGTWKYGEIVKIIIPKAIHWT